MTRVALIDDGVLRDELDGISVRTFSVQGGIVREDTDDSLCGEHGTICAKILTKYAPYVEIVSIRILDIDGFGDTYDLYIALQWCLSHDIDVVNLSNGIELSSSPSKLYDICNRLAAKGTVIIAAQSNRPVKTYPACFPSVISVEQAILRPSANPLRKSNIYAPGSHSVRFRNQIIHPEPSNSYACAFASSFLIRNDCSINLSRTGIYFFEHKLLMVSNSISTYQLPYLFSYEAASRVKAGEDCCIVPAASISPFIKSKQEMLLSTRVSRNMVSIMRQCYRYSPDFFISEAKLSFVCKLILNSLDIRRWDPPGRFHSFNPTCTIDPVVLLIKTASQTPSLFHSINCLVDSLCAYGNQTICISTFFEGYYFGNAYAPIKDTKRTLDALIAIVHPDVVIMLANGPYPEADLCSEHISDSLVFEDGKCFSIEDSQVIADYLVNTFSD